MSLRVGGFTLACRYICSALIAGPLLYWSSATDGDAYHFLALVVLAPIAGLVLFANSLFCLFRYRNWKSASFSLIFIFVSVIGVLTARYFLPQFRM
jgi:hypothetical protein